MAHFCSSTLSSNWYVKLINFGKNLLGRSESLNNALALIAVLDDEWIFNK